MALFRKKDEYMDLVLLLRRTTKIESMLEVLGGEGNGIFKKAEALKTFFPEDFMQTIIKIGEARNSAIHGDLKVKNIQNTIQTCDTAIEILERRIELYKLKKEMDIKLKEIHYFDKKNPIILDDKIQEWIITLNRMYTLKTVDIKRINTFLVQEKKVFKKLDRYAKEYVIEKRKKQIPIFAVMFSIVLIALIAFKELV